MTGGVACQGGCSVWKNSSCLLKRVEWVHVCHWRGTVEHSGIYRSVLWVEGGITPFSLSWVNPTSCKALTATQSPLCPQHTEEKIGGEKVRKLMGQGKGLHVRKVRRGWGMILKRHHLWFSNFLVVGCCRQHYSSVPKISDWWWKKRSVAGEMHPRCWQ